MKQQRLIIFHPSDFSEDSRIAFAHAVKIVLDTQGTLDILHVENGQSPDREDYPQVRSLLEKWKVIPPNSSKTAIADLHMYVRKAIKKKKDPIDACLHHLEQRPADLIVLMVHQSKLHWLTRRVGEPIARKSQQATLFIPQEVKGFVSTEDGSMNLQHVLIPIAKQPHPEHGITHLKKLAGALGIDLKISFLHVGNKEDAPKVESTIDPEWTCETLIKQGNPADVIIETAEELQPDMVLMVTEGRNGFMDAFRGSISERVLKNVNCPLLTIPAN